MKINWIKVLDKVPSFIIGAIVGIISMYIVVNYINCLDC